MEMITANVDVLAEQMELTIEGLAAVMGGLEAIPTLATTMEALAFQVAEATEVLRTTTTTQTGEPRGWDGDVKDID